MVFTDLSMPMMDGYRLSAKIRKLYKKYRFSKDEEPTIIALTGHTESEFFTHAFKMGVDQVYSKPVQREVIRTCLLERGFRVELK